MFKSLYSWGSYLIPGAGHPQKPTKEGMTTDTNSSSHKTPAAPAGGKAAASKEKTAAAAAAASGGKAPAPARPRAGKIDPSRAKVDPVFWSTYQAHLCKALSLSRRIQAFDTTVFVAPPGINVAEHLYVNEDGISVSVQNGNEHNIPDLELYTARLEELAKHSAEVNQPTILVC